MWHKIKNTSIWKTFAVIITAIVVLLIATSQFNYNCQNAYAENSDEQNAYLQDLAAKVDSIQTQINNYQAKLEDATQALADANQAKEEAQEEYDFACARIEQLKPDLQEASKNSYAAHLAIALLEDLVGNNFITSAVFNETIINIFTNHDDILSQEIVDLYKIEENSYREIVKAEETAKYEIANSVKARKDLDEAYAQIIDELNVANDNLNDKIEYEKLYGKPGPSCISGNGLFAHPCPTGTMSSPFGELREREDGSSYTHKGIDFSASEGTPIYAAADGTVIESTFTDDYNGGRGMWIVISHGNGIVTQYLHCSHVFYPKGAKIKKGDHIANVGNTGDSYGSHVHFQVEENGQPVDGMEYLTSKED